MKILHIIPTYKPAYSRGGPIWSVHALNKSLVKKGMDVTVYTTNIAVEEEVPTNRAVNLDGVNVYYFPSSFPKKWEHSKKMRKSLSESINEYDLVHITSVFLSASTCASYYARKNDIPYVISPRGALMKEHIEGKNNLLKKLYLNLIEKRNLRKSSGIHFTVKDEKKEYERLALPLPDPIIIPNGLEPEEFDLDVEKGKFRKEYNIPEDKKIILFLGRIGKEKGLDTLIPSFKEVLEKYENTVLVIAGGDDKVGYRSKVEKMVKKNGLEDDVIFTGMVLDEDKVAVYQDADIFALPSYSENFGIVVAEAMYFGLPVVTTPNVGAANIVKKYNAGLVVEKDKEEVSDSMLKILKDESLLKDMSENGKKVAKKEFSMDSVANKWIRTYNNIIEEYNN